jgi:hypothetical protein
VVKRQLLLAMGSPASPMPLCNFIDLGNGNVVNAGDIAYYTKYPAGRTVIPSPDLVNALNQELSQGAAVTADESALMVPREQTGPGSEPVYISSPLQPVPASAPTPLQTLAPVQAIAPVQSLAPVQTLAPVQALSPAIVGATPPVAVNSGGWTGDITSVLSQAGVPQTVGGVPSWAIAAGVGVVLLLMFMRK